ncbi:hypothetical protein DAI22_11g205601 [Oryza sativa Japonica Group]|nr:hypothetical protein DAI22_11g205601 [Oryza sativa Japonica Group]
MLESIAAFDGLHVGRQPDEPEHHLLEVMAAVLLRQRQRRRHRASAEALRQLPLAHQLQPRQVVLVRRHQQVLRHDRRRVGVAVAGDVELARRQLVGVDEVEERPEHVGAHVVDADHRGAAIALRRLLHRAEQLRLEDERPRGEHVAVRGERRLLAVADVAADDDRHVGGVRVAEEVAEVPAERRRRRLHGDDERGALDGDVAPDGEPVVPDAPRRHVQLLRRDEALEAEAGVRPERAPEPAGDLRLRRRRRVAVARDKVDLHVGVEADVDAADAVDEDGDMAGGGLAVPVGVVPDPPWLAAGDELGGRDVRPVLRRLLGLGVAVDADIVAHPLDLADDGASSRRVS